MINFPKNLTPANLMSYDEYLRNFESQSIKIKDEEKNNLIKLNQQRSLRIHKSYRVNKQLFKKISQIKIPQLWLVLTEYWCGDSAQNIPYLAEISKSNSNINLEILLREENLEIMDLYLTDNKSRSIPKLISFDKEGNEIFVWGPRPLEAQNLVIESKKIGKLKEEYMTDLHRWYANDKGQSLEKELENIFDTILLNYHNQMEMLS